MIKLFLTIIVLMLISLIIPGITINGFWAGLLAALIFGIVNTLVKPIFIVLTLPITIFTLGLFLIVINGLMFYLTSYFVSGFHVANMFSAIIGSLIISIVPGVIK